MNPTPEADLSTDTQSAEILVYFAPSHAGTTQSVPSDGICLIAVYQSKVLLAIKSVLTFGISDHDDYTQAMDVLLDFLDEEDIDPSTPTYVLARNAAESILHQIIPKAKTILGPLPASNLATYNALTKVIGTSGVINKKSGTWAESVFISNYTKAFAGYSSITPSSAPSNEIGFDFGLLGGSGYSLYVEVKLKSGSRISITEAQLDKIRSYPKQYSLVVVHKNNTMWICDNPFDWISNLFGSYPLAGAGGIRPRIPSDIKPTTAYWRIA